MRKPTVISLFSGCGGMDLGFKNAGFKIIWANDFYKDAVNTYKKNIGNYIVLGDIIDIPSNEIPDNPDVLLGGFPCQGFSIANTNRDPKDDRNFLYKEMVRIIKDKKPKFFVGENVKGILSIDNGKFIKKIIRDFTSLGYKIEYRLLNTIHYGVPQSRERVIIIGNRIDADNIFPKKTHGFKNGLKKPSTTEETIGHLCKIPLSENPVIRNGKKILNHIAKTKIDDKFYGRKNPPNQFDICDYLKYWRDKKGYTTKQIDDLFGYTYTAGHWFRKDNNSGSIPNSKDWKKLKKILVFDDIYDKQVLEMELKTITYETSRRINNWNTTNDTIIATGSEIHPKSKRRLSIRESAIIQTFPNNFEFTGSIGAMQTQVGNAVPVLFAQQIAKCIMNSLKVPLLVRAQKTRRTGK